MGASIIFDDALSLRYVRTATVDTVVDYLRRCVPNHPDFKPIFDNARLYEATKDWRFDRVSLDGLRLMRGLLEQMAGKLPELLAPWREESRPYFVEDLASLRRILDARIERLERHGGQVPSLNTFSFGEILYWEAPQESARIVLDYLRRQAICDVGLREAIDWEPAYNLNWNFRPVSADGLREMERLLKQFRQTLSQVVADRPKQEQAKLAEDLDALCRVIEMRLRELPPPNTDTAAP